MSWLFNVCYLLVLIAASPWVLWQALRHGKYREGAAAKLLGRVDVLPTSRPTIWVHAVSVGEVKLAAKLVPALAVRFPDHRFVVSSTSRTGYHLARRELSQADCLVTYAPLDFSWAVDEAVRRIGPAALVLVELELWPNLISKAEAAGCPVFVVNGRLSQRSLAGYRRLAPLVAWVLRKIDWVGAQNPTYQQRFAALGSPSVTVTGSIKFDGLETDRANPRTQALAQLAGLSSQQTVWLAGSTQPVEDEQVVRLFTRLASRFPDLRLILVPRHPENFDAAARRAAASGLVSCRRSELGRSELGRSQVGGSPDLPWRILVVDAVGELGAWWGTADLAFVGGSLCRRGGQNMIEPAAFGAAVSFGPHTENFRDIAAALLAQTAAVVVDDEESLERFVARCCTDLAYRTELGHAARRWVGTQAGALQRTCDALESRWRVDRRQAA